MAREDSWNDEELEAAVRGYAEMLAAERSGDRYSKSEINQRLRSGPLAARSKGSVEYRMQNISAVLDSLNLPWVEGYKPAKNVGAAAKKIRQLLADCNLVDHADQQPTDELEELDRRTSKLRVTFGKALSRSRPHGVEAPTRTKTFVSAFSRDPFVRAWVLEKAGGVCEACSLKALFVTDDGLPFLEVHHVIRLAEGGPDTIENSVAVCPNCHRRLHFSKDRAQITAGLYSRCGRLKR